MRYRLIAIDLDGTLLSPDGTVSAANRAAIARAQDAGVTVVPCTGRAWHESHAAIDGIGGLDRGVFVTGAMISEIHTGQTLQARPFDPAVVAELVATIADLPEAVLVFRDRDQTGHDYLVTGNGRLQDNTRWWFEHTDAKVREDPSPDEWSHCVRVAVVSRSGTLDDAQRRLTESCGDRIALHCFAGIPRQARNESVDILGSSPPAWTSGAASAASRRTTASPTTPSPPSATRSTMSLCCVTRPAASRWATPRSRPPPSPTAAPCPTARTRRSCDRPHARGGLVMRCWGHAH